MSKHSEMLRQRNRMIENEAKIQMNRAHTLGLQRGTYAVAQIVLTKAQDETKTIEERLEDIVAFCSKARDPDSKPAETSVPEADPS